jgi:hypothetical protein
MLHYIPHHSLKVVTLPGDRVPLASMRPGRFGLIVSAVVCSFAIGQSDIDMSFKPLILIVDDDLESCELLFTQLSTDGCFGHGWNSNGL